MRLTKVAQILLGSIVVALPASAQQAAPVTPAAAESPTAEPVIERVPLTGEAINIADLAAIPAQYVPPAPKEGEDPVPVFEDAAIVRQHLAPTETERAWTMVEDPVMARGGCQAISASSRVDARLDTRLTTMLTELLGEQTEAEDRRGSEARP